MLAPGVGGGLTGSIAASMLATIPSITLGLVYIAVFGLGSVGGMLLMSAIIGAPFAVTARRFSKLNGGIRLAAGLLSDQMRIGAADQAASTSLSQARWAHTVTDLGDGRVLIVLDLEEIFQ